MPLRPAGMGAREHDRNWLRRRDIVTRREVRLLDVVEKRAHRLRRQSDRKPPAHFPPPRARRASQPRPPTIARCSAARKTGGSPFRASAKRALTFTKEMRRKRTAARLSW